MLTANKQIEAALKDKLFINKSKINSDPIYRGLKEVSIKRYNKIWDFWIAYINNIIKLSLKSKLTRLKYKKKFPNLDLRKIKDIKHIAKAIACLTCSKLGKRATVKLV
jgi:hypothetical protein